MTVVPVMVAMVSPCRFVIAQEVRLGAAYPFVSVSYTHLRAHETVLDIVCRLLLEKKTIYDASPEHSPQIHNYICQRLNRARYSIQ